jgi:hypothetical protein
MRKIKDPIAIPSDQNQADYDIRLCAAFSFDVSIPARAYGK